MILNGQVFGADGVIFDLEDAVSPSEKDAARLLVKHMLEQLDYEGTELIVRINALTTPYWQDDLRAVCGGRRKAIMLPKSQSVEDLVQLDGVLTEIEQERGLAAGKTEVIPLIETTLGIENVWQIVGASRRITAVLLGAEDLTADLGAKRTKPGREIFYSRSRMVIAAKAAGIEAIDTPFTDTNDESGLARDASLAKELGFDGKAVISPRHIDVVNSTFSPGAEEIAAAKRVVAAIEAGEREGKGVVSLDGKMVDAPVAARARKVLEMAERIGGKHR
jgi:citrate lyase subunit beta/citryl-CoA lyase